MLVSEFELFCAGDDGRLISSPESPPVEVVLRPPGGAVKEQISCDLQTAAKDRITEEFAKSESTAFKTESSVEQAKSAERSVSMDFETKNVGARMKSSSKSMGSIGVENGKEKEALHESVDQDGSWLSGWGFKPLTQLTGAVIYVVFITQFE